MKQYRFILRLTSMLLICFACSPAGASGQDLELYHQANIAYQKQDYEKAIRLYQSLIQKKQLSAEVYYNLGNSYYKSGNTPRSILNYERALKLSPGDEDILFNLKVASLKMVDKIDAIPEIFYRRWFRALTALFPTDTWSSLLVVWLWLALASALFYLFTKSRGFKKIGFIGLLTALFFAATTYLIALQSYRYTTAEEHAIILSASVYVKSSPDDKGNDLFIIHEGTKVQVMDKLNDWSKIRIANGSIGWLKMSELEII